jgi:hypothetical protein
MGVLTWHRLPNGFGFSCGHVRLASRIHVAITSASRIMVANQRLALSKNPAENKGRQLQTRVERNRAQRAVAQRGKTVSVRR